VLLPSGIYAGLWIHEGLGSVRGVPAPTRIGAVLNDEPAANAAMTAKLAAENRPIWEKAPGEIVCRSSRATHVFFDYPANPYRLATWDDTGPSFRSRPPRRVLFGLLARAGTAGNQFYEFLVPGGGTVTFEHITLYGPEPAYEYSVRGPEGDEPCLNHERYEGG
jgi:hypothetical protein